jgi:hypothetical protein
MQQLAIFFYNLLLTSLLVADLLQVTYVINKSKKSTESPASTIIIYTHTAYKSQNTSEYIILMSWTINYLRISVMMLYH